WSVTGVQTCALPIWLCAIEFPAFAVERCCHQAVVAREAEAYVIAAEAERQLPVPWPARPQAMDLHTHAREASSAEDESRKKERRSEERRVGKKRRAG